MGSMRAARSKKPYLMLVGLFLVSTLGNASFAQFGSDLGVNDAAILERSAREVQESLIWLDLYNGMVDGKLGARSVAAIRKFQSLHGHLETGELSDDGYADLVERASRARSIYGWSMFEHPSLGYRIGYPAAEMQHAEPLKNGGRRFSSKTGDLVLEVEVAAGGLSALDDFHQKLSRSSPTRTVRYERHRDNWSVVSGVFEESSFYTRIETQDGYLIGYTFRWPSSRDQELERVSIAIASSFYIPSTLVVPSTAEPAAPTERLEERGLVIETKPAVTNIVIPKTKLREAPLDPRDLFLLVKDSVYMVLAVSAKGGEPDLENASQGSAVVISPTHLLTNCHVLEEQEGYLVLRMDREEMYRAQLRAGDPETDRCILEAEGASFKSFVPIRRTKELQVGERVYSIGAPSGLDLTIAEGLLSGFRRDGDTVYLQNSAPISPGSSGGGLFDEHGNLIGITTFLLKDAQSLNFAISADEYLELR